VRAKDAILSLLDRLPDDCSFDDVLHHVYVAREVEAGIRAAHAGRIIPHDQLMQQLRKRFVLSRRKPSRRRR
jgi:predicted transcriptional regulator